MALDLFETNISGKSSEGYEFEVTLPGLNEGTGTFMTVRGENSPEVEAHSKRIFNKMQARNKQAQRRGKEAEEPSLEEYEEMAVEGALVRLIGWRDLLEGGVEVEFNEENARKVLTKHKWIRQQILDESNEVANFI